MSHAVFLAADTLLRVLIQRMVLAGYKIKAILKDCDGRTLSKKDEDAMEKRTFIVHTYIANTKTIYHRHLIFIKSIL